MSQTFTLQDGLLSDRREKRPSIWGLTAPQLHEAYWRSRGVQCVHRGEAAKLSRNAELFLLLEPGQMVLFDLHKLVDRLVWHKAAVTRLRVVDQEDECYREQVITDKHGLIQRIERRYQPDTRATYRVLITPRRRIASLWITATNRRKGWDAVRRAVAWSRVDHSRCPGGCFMEGNAQEEHDLISRLVARWHDPAQVLEGIEEAAPKVWKARGDTIAAGTVLVGPLWIGHGGVEEGACLVGPIWTTDQRTARTDNAHIRLRNINDIGLDEAPRSREATANRETGYALTKRAFDVVFSLIALLLASPIFVLAGLCIVLADGRPVFYAHTRQTRGGKQFKCWKFRTMHRNAGPMTAELSAKNLCDGPQVFIRDDPRVTKVGGVLRKFQIDEFPQFWNVLLGQMSIVGPRPSPDDENQLCPAWRDLRLSVRPGITGLWQINRTRAPGKDFQEWIRYDVEYVRRASFWLDLKICVKTAWLLMTGGRSTGG